MTAESLSQPKLAGRNLDSQALAREIRVAALHMVHKTKASHIGSGFSMADILAVLYGSVLRVTPDRMSDPHRDRLIISKGHAAATVYAALACTGFFDKRLLAEYSTNGSMLTGHVSAMVPGVEFSTGSLGHGLSVACGMALAARIDKAPWRAFCLQSDGECNEGAIWEAALFAGHHGLDNLVLMIDYNKIQSFGRVEEVLRLEPLADKWRAFGWAVAEIDGHDHAQLESRLLQLPIAGGRPQVIICHTVKGKGVSFMEDRLEWHYKSPNDEQLAAALRELGEG